VVVGVALLAPVALAATNLAQKEGVDGCVTEDGLNGSCQDGRGLVAPAEIALSPDGRNAYVTTARSESVNGVTTLARDSGNGALRPIDDPASCLVEVDFPYPSCAHGRELRGAEGVAVSPDGKNVYVASPGSDALTVFDRDSETGLLTQAPEDDGCINMDGSDECAEGRALEGASAISVSPDGKSVYLASNEPGGGIAVFRRDPESGDLTQLEGAAGCVNESGAEECTDGFNVLTRPEGAELSPDGRFLYVPSRPGDQIVLFSRDSSDGALTRIPAPSGCVNETGANGCGEAKALGNPVALAYDSAGTTLYSANERADSIVVFDRDPNSGLIEEKPGLAGCISNTGWANPMNPQTEEECQDGIGLDGVDSLAVSPDNAAVYAASGLSDGLAIFERTAEGGVSQRPGSYGCITNSGYEAPEAPWTMGFCMNGRALRRASSVTVGPDSLQVYAVAREGGADSFDVVAPPPTPVAEEPAAPLVKPPPGNDRRACREVIGRRRAVTEALAKALRQQRRLRRRLHRLPGSSRLIETLAQAHRRVKKLRRTRHLALHRERRLCK
jgi:DNA-binding beta-propeller fold protein YncE